MHTAKSKDWRQLSEAASREQDPKKLMELIDELTKVLDDRHGRSLAPHYPEGNETDLAPDSSSSLSLPPLR